MGIFVCAHCGTIDNTAMDNNYWRRKKFKPPFDVCLCTCCTPKSYDATVYGNKPWHNKFPKQTILDDYKQHGDIEKCKSGIENPEVVYNMILTLQLRETIK